MRFALRNKTKLINAFGEAYYNELIASINSFQSNYTPDCHYWNVVTISKEDGLWTLHVISEAPIGLPLIKEVRYKYLPNNLMMAQIFGDRAEANEIKGVILYQIPNGEMEAE